MESEVEAPTCRVCYIDGKEEPLFFPCRCSGTLKYLHQSCWNRIVSYNAKKRILAAPKCDVCLYRIKTRKVTKDNGPVTNRVYWHAVGMYFLAYLFRLFSLATLCVPFVFIRGDPSLWSFLFCAAIQMLILALIVLRMALGAGVFGHNAQEGQLPIVGDLRSVAKIRNMNYAKIVDTEGPFTFLLLFSSLASSMMVTAILRLRPQVRPVEVSVDIWDYMMWICSFYTSTTGDVLIIILVLLYATHLVYFTPASMSTSIVWCYLHVAWIGRLVNSIVTTYCTGCFTDLYASAPFLYQLCLDGFVGKYCVYNLVVPFHDRCSLYLKFPLGFLPIFDWPFLHQSYSKKCRAAMLALVWSHLFIAIHIFVPLVATSYFFPTWTNMGACLKPSYQNLSSDPEVQKNVALLAAVLSRVNFATKVIFVVDRVICLGPLYLWMHFFLNCAYKWLNLKKKKETHVSAAVKMVLLSPFLCLSVTFCYWFAAFLGQSVIENGPIPTYFGNYRDDIFFQLLIGFSVLRIFFTMMPRAIISLCKIASFSLASVVYYAFFGDVRFAPILPETLFLLSWLVTLDMWDPPKQYLKMVTNVLRISTGGLLLVAILHLMKFAHGYDSVLDVHSNNADPALIFKCSAVIWMAAKVWNFFHTLKYHLRYEYGQLVEELLNYVDRPKRHGKLCRLQNSIKNLVKRCGDYDIHRWVVCRLLSDEK
ncbi:hypothetical protein QR680_009994 [Steinernema hermaphroditum]|uniref:RING-CH-type domain-containing protein n=1 Tax=Steinernema hermaphroditum TaxID=289476 RepID=A0AA39IPS8_9BILA|nr:hypothetical protein QR680_009994 [Steinernema hermaphroditum]